MLELIGIRIAQDIYIVSKENAAEDLCLDVVESPAVINGNIGFIHILEPVFSSADGTCRKNRIDVLKSKDFTRRNGDGIPRSKCAALPFDFLFQDKPIPPVAAKHGNTDRIIEVIKNAEIRMLRIRHTREHALHAASVTHHAGIQSVWRDHQRAEHSLGYVEYGTSEFRHS